LYVGSHTGIEKSLAKNAKLNYKAISTGKLRRYFSVKNFTDPFRILAGYFEAKKILKAFQPKVVFCAGGFVSVPVGLAAKSLKIPLILNEADATPGLSTKILTRYADTVCTAFPLKHASAKHVHTGLPLQPHVTKGKKSRGQKLTNLTRKKPNLLIMGGSLGAQFINDFVTKNLTELTKNYNVIHLTGKGKNPKLENKNYWSAESVSASEIADLYALSDLCLTRAGANSLFELAANSIPMLMIPLPLTASRGDQILNANYFQKAKCGLKLDQERATDQKILNSLEKLKSQKYAPTLTSPDGLPAIIKILNKF